MEEHKPKYYEHIEIGISRIEIEVEEEEIIKKISFTTTLGLITYKPTIILTSKIDGFNISKRTKATLTNMPEKLKELNNELNKFGVIDVYASFQLWRKDNNEYRFVQGEKMLNKWQIIPKENKKIKNLVENVEMTL